MTSETPEFYVELDVFSGRPNPVWPLTPDESRELLALVDQLEPDGPKSATGLGYRGFIVFRPEIGGPKRWLYVGQGTVSIGDRNLMQGYRDTANIEGWLRDQAIARGFGVLVASEGK